jgi:DNA-binding MarR family transcriptional regulator
MVQLMENETRLGTGPSPPSVNTGDTIAEIETEMADLTRVLESLHRRGDIYRDMDRASYLIARALEGTGPISVNGLASMLALDATTVTRQIATMESAQLTRRAVDPADGRVRLISLTARGRQKMRTVQEARTSRLAQLLADWDDDDRQAFTRLLAKFNSELRGVVLEAAPTAPARRPTRGGAGGQ